MGWYRLWVSTEITKKHFELSTDGDDSRILTHQLSNLGQVIHSWKPFTKPPSTKQTANRTNGWNLQTVARRSQQSRVSSVSKYGSSSRTSVDIVVYSCPFSSFETRCFCCRYLSVQSPTYSQQFANFGIFG